MKLRTKLRNTKLAFPIYRTEEQIKRIEEMEEKQAGVAPLVPQIPQAKKSFADYIKSYVVSIMALSAFIGVILGGYQYYASQEALAQAVQNNTTSIEIIRTERDVSSLTANYYELLSYGRKFHVDDRLQKQIDHAYRAMVAAEEQLRKLKGN